ncbi:hypothetical protein [Streptomyces sp. NRRL S-241]|uniref:hypothetical protein n=1 Tax=Streptomyces sp. NRRL S-241 TaxID=1463896 RepID=UPI0004C107C1|nr:hypothetical protein [Streptomyces sp. NRRL S-241]
MPLDLNRPYEVSCFSTLHPDRLVGEVVGDPLVIWELDDLFPGSGTYTTVPLDAETDMHYRPGDPGAPNTVAQHLAALYGFDDLDVRGPVHFTGPSGETDRAFGMDTDTFGVLYDRLTEVCTSLGVRLWRKIHPSDTVSVRYTDLTYGDTFWDLNHAHRFLRFEDLPAESKTLDRIPEARYMVCDDEEVFLAYGTYECRADRAPAGYWQRTGNQLLNT